MDKEKIVREAVGKVLELDDPTVKNLKIDDDLKSFNFNSLKTIELIVELEDIFNVEISEEELVSDNVNTIKDIMGIISKYCS